MEVSQLLMTAANVLAIGMIVVFLFLGLLVIATKMLSRFCAVDQVSSASTQTKQTLSSEVDGITPQTVAAISAAVAQYRKNTQTQE